MGSGGTSRKGRKVCKWKRGKGRRHTCHVSGCPVCFFAVQDFLDVPMLAVGEDCERECGDR